MEDPDTTATTLGEVFPKDEVFYTVNGQVKPTLGARPGEVLRLRCVNATIGSLYPLALDQHDLYTVAFDGISLSRPRVSTTEFVTPGNRVDLLIKAGVPGTYVLRGLEYARSDTLVRDEVELLTLIVEGAPVQMDLPTDLPAPYASIRDSELTGSRTVVYDTVDNTGQFPSGYTVDQALPIDGKLFDSNRVDQGVDDRESRRRGPRLPHPHEPGRDRRSKRCASRHAAVGRHLQHPAKRRFIHLPDSLPRFRRPEGPPLPHPRPRGPRHDAARPDRRLRVGRGAA